MMVLFHLTLKRLLSRKLISFLLIISIALSTFLLIGVQKVKQSAKQSFSQSISGTDLIVGARSGDIQLLMYLIFRQGQAVANMSWDSIQRISDDADVKWVVPISLGDSHRGFPVVGTTNDYFSYYKYANKKDLKLFKGTTFNTPLDLVLGAEVAKKFGYKVGDRIYLAHGRSLKGGPIHKQFYFTVVGILDYTRTPVDKTLHIPIEGMTALHMNLKKILGGKPIDADALTSINLTPRSVTGCLVGLNSKFAIFNVKQRIISSQNEPLMAVIPGVALSQLWSSIRTIDAAFSLMTWVVVVIAFLGLLTSLFMSLHTREKELRILRVLGANPVQLFMLLMIESLLITVIGVASGIFFLLISSVVLIPYLESTFGLILSVNQITLMEFRLVLMLVLSGLIISVFPGIRVYRDSKRKGIMSL